MFRALKMPHASANRPGSVFRSNAASRSFSQVMALSRFLVLMGNATITGKVIEASNRPFNPEKAARYNAKSFTGTKTMGVLLSVLSDLHKSGIKVSDIAAQYWCERQMELRARHGAKITNEIRKGAQIHGELEDQVNVPMFLQPKSYPDYMYKQLYTSHAALVSLRENGKGREIQMYGSIGGYRLVGRIDMLQMSGGKVVIWEDKTKANGKPPSEAQLHTNRIQLLVYRRMLDDLVSGDYTERNFTRAYSTEKMVLTAEFVRQLKALGVPDPEMDIGRIAGRLFTEFRGLGSVSDSMRLRYLQQSTGNEIQIYSFDYNKEETQGIVKYVLGYWNGERESNPVPESEKWKCEWCEFFGDKCKVWWGQRG